MTYVKSDLERDAATAVPFGKTAEIPQTDVERAIKAVQANIAAGDAALAAHLADPTDAHDASAISFAPAGTIAATEVQAALAELDGDIQAHIADGSAAHAASAISYAGGPGLSATDVEGALDELATISGSGGLLAQSGAAASHTGNTSETTLATITVPANAMGPNGALRVTTLWSVTNNANDKTPIIRFGGTGGTQYLGSPLSMSGTAIFQAMTIIRNRNATNSQIGYDQATVMTFGSSTNANQTSSVDTTAAADIVIRGQLANAADTITLEAYTVELLVP